VNTVEVVLFTIIMLECLLASFYAFRFVNQYRNVSWRGSGWGEHIMTFSLIVGLLFAFTFIGNIIQLVGVKLPQPWHQYARYAWGVLSIILFGGAAWQLRKRGQLEQETNRLREERRAAK
jgi:cytochrome c biogenesis protein CcdA